MGDPSDPRLRTVHLGQFDRRTADRIAARLEEAGIAWWCKEPGPLSRIWEVGVRLFVDRERLEEARGIVRSLREGRAGEHPDPS